MITTLAEWKEHKNKRGRMLSARYAQALGYFQREDWCVKDCGDTQCWIDPKTDKVVCAVDEFSPHSDDHWQMEKIRSLHISLRRVVELGTPSDVKWEARIPAIGENNSGASAIEEVLEHAILMAVIIREENRCEQK